MPNRDEPDSLVDKVEYYRKILDAIPNVDFAAGGYGDVAVHFRPGQQTIDRIAIPPV